MGRAVNRGGNRENRPGARDGPGAPVPSNNIDNVIGGITERFKTMKQICNKFSFLWLFADMSKEDLRGGVTTFFFGGQ